MKKGVGAKRCSCSVVLEDLMNDLAERVKKGKYFKDMSTADKFVHLQSPIVFPEIADCDCAAGLAIKEIMKEVSKAGAVKNKNESANIITIPFNKKIRQKIRSFFPCRY